NVQRCGACQRIKESLCSAIPIPNNRKKYRIRKSRTYKGKPHNSHVNPFKRKYKDDKGRVKKCKCFICGKEGYFAKDCRIDYNDSSVYSISEGEGDVHQNISVMVQDTPFEEAAFMTIEGFNESDDERSIKENYDDQNSHHAFMFYPGPPTKIADMENAITNYTICYYCGILTTDMSRLKCPKCQLTACALYARNYLGKIVNVKGKQPHKPEEKKDFSSNEVKLLKELLKEKTKQSEKSLLVKDLTDALKIIDQLKIEQIRLEEQKNEEIKKLKTQMQKEKEKETEAQYSSEEFPPLGKSQIARPFMEAEATHRIKKISFLIGGNKFKIPLIYAFDMRDSNGIEMLIGANFLSFMKGGIRIEGDEITIYKKVTKIKTSNQTKVVKIAELEVSEEEFLKINESIYFNQEGSKNGELCKLDIINPDITIEDRPLKYVTLAMEDSFKKHVDSLLKIGAIRPSKSRHRIMAMIVNSGTTIDPTTGREIKGKERMVFNYKSLNGNTYKDQYSLLGINTIIKRVGGAKIFSKFDLESRFYQVAMDEESITWTTFLVPGGLYEWLVMPFGLKIPQQYSNEKMDKCFKGTESVIAVSIDDILSPTKIKILVPTIDFLGAVIGEGTIKLQPHIIKKIVNFNEEELKTKKGLRRNEAISSSSSLLSGGSPTVPICLSEEYEDHMRRSHEDFQPLLRIFTKAIFTHKEPGSLYKHYQLKANKTPIIMDKSNAWRTVTQDIKVSASKEAVKAMRSLQAIIQCKAQICFGKSTKDNHWSDQREYVKVQNKEAKRILIELEALAQRLGRNNI
nr:TPA: orf y [Tanacetum cinerariifolium]